MRVFDISPNPKHTFCLCTHFVKLLLDVPLFVWDYNYVCSCIAAHIVCVHECEYVWVHEYMCACDTDLLVQCTPTTLAICFSYSPHTKNLIVNNWVKDALSEKTCTFSGIPFHSAGRATNESDLLLCLPYEAFGTILLCQNMASLVVHCLLLYHHHTVQVAKQVLICMCAH